MLIKLVYIIVLCVIALSTIQCQRDGILTNTNAKLEFSKDTIIFDTVFTTIGSTTQQLKFYNRNKGDIEISSIKLAGGSSSPFRINIDGVSSTEVNDIIIERDDSLFLFAEVTLEANNQTNPLIIEDSIIFFTNGNRQSVKLVVWGQDAYFHANELVEGTWMNDKPHVIYGIAAVGFPNQDSGKTLNIPAGTEVYMHANSFLYVYKSTLNVQGTEGNEVVFQGDRLESYYQDIPGQWDGIWLIHSENSNISHAIIKNGTKGIWAFKTNPGSINPALTLSHTESYNNAFSGIWTDESFVLATNNLFRDNGQYCGLFLNGGTYNFNHCTFANYYNFGDRNSPAFRLNNFFQIPETTTLVGFDITNTKFENCIFYGSRAHEFAIDTIGNGSFSSDFIFENCLIKSDETSTPTGNFYQNILKNVNPLFADQNEGDFHLKSNSQAINAGNLNNPGIDIDNTPRSSIGDLGCYEYQ